MSQAGPKPPAPEPAREQPSPRAAEVRRRLERGAYVIDLDDLAEAVLKDLDDEPRCPKR